MKKSLENNISAELLAAFLDGNATAEESVEILEALPKNPELRELLHISQSVDAALGLVSQGCDFVPAMAMAASCHEDNYCCLECEKYILRQFDIEFDEGQLLADAIRNGWQKEEGTALHNVGRHLEAKGLLVERRYNCTLEDMAESLNDHKGVIVAVDGGELLGNSAEEMREDILVGQIPDHTVVVLSLDCERGLVTLFDPNSSNSQDSYSTHQFLDAWNDSKNYMVIASNEL